MPKPSADGADPARAAMVVSRSLPHIVLPGSKGRPPTSSAPLTVVSSPSPGVPSAPVGGVRMPRSSSWRQHTLFQALSESENVQRVENRRLLERIAELEHGASRLHAHVAGLEAERQRCAPPAPAAAPARTRNGTRSTMT